jgi:transposase
MHENDVLATRIREILGVSRASVFEWIAKYREGGPAAISTKIASGRPTALDDSEMIRPYAMISGKDPRTRGFGMALWSGALIQGEPQSHLCWS